MPEESSLVSIHSIALLFLKLGLLAFGGPAAHVALMRREIVERHRWIEEREFMQMFAACNVIPGPSSTELAIFIGYRLAGRLGLVLAGSLFILPAMLIMLVIAALYVNYGSTHVAISALNGIRPVVLSIIAWALWDLGKRMLTRRALWPIAVAVFVLSLISVNPILLLLIAGIASVLVTVSVERPSQRSLLIGGKVSLPVVMVLHSSRLGPLFLTFLKLGLVSYGSGYVLFAFLHADFVSGFHWLTNSQLADAVAIGQATPGPVFTTATFLGYLFAGVPGALLATLGIFLPGFVLVLFLDRIMRIVQAHVSARAFLDGVNVGALGLIAAVTALLAHTTIHDPLTVALAIAAFPILIWRPFTSPALITIGGIVGIVAGR